MFLSGMFLFFASEFIISFFSNEVNVIEFGSKYLKICAFILPTYPIFFLSNGLLIAIKKGEYAMLSNLFRNGINPILVFIYAKYLNASFVIFFCIWAIINWIFSGFYFLIIILFLKKKLYKSSTIINPQP